MWLSQALKLPASGDEATFYPSDGGRVLVVGEICFLLWGDKGWSDHPSEKLTVFSSTFNSK